MGKLLSKSEGFNENYLVQVVKISNMRKHEFADRLQITTIEGNNIITDLSTKIDDIRLLFPLECAINAEYLSKNNDFRPELNLNEDPAFNTATNPEIKKVGFDENCRVRAQKIRQIPSQGYLVPVKTLSFILTDKEIAEIEASVGECFDTVKDFLLVKKYIPKNTKQQGAGGKKEGRKAKLSKIIDNQLRYHFDTANLNRNIHKVTPNSFITISDKWHGSSFVVSNVLCLKPLKWYEKLLKKLGVNIVDKQHDNVYSSRRVIKNSDLNPIEHQHYYKTDIWGEVANKIYPLLAKGETVYGEVVGYVGSGAIQSLGGKDYDYGCQPGEWKAVVYRITNTNPDGFVVELTSSQMIERCAILGLDTVPILWSGFAKDKYPELGLDQHWNENFLEKLKEEYLEKKCIYCKSQPWAEGIVLRLDTLTPECFKLKSFEFLQETSKGFDSGKFVDLEEESQITE